jgi:hypothetical protein
MGNSGNLERMKITAFQDSDFQKKAGEFMVYINPEKYSHTYQITYNDVQAQGSSGGSPDFNKTPSETVEFELVFDGTGVVPSPTAGVPPASSDGIAKQIDAFKKLVFTFNGNIHSPNFLELAWGKLLFRCRLSKLTINYTLFKPDGSPLRARANASFTGYNDEETLALMANKTSPDLSHILTVRAGDILPLMCFDVYGSSAYYPQVARVNGLTEFRQLTPGTQLLFPPLGAAAP